MQIDHTTGGVIYCFKNKANGKEYIGKTSDELAKRVARHVITANFSGKSKSIFHRALSKYGIDGFDVSVLAEAATREELDRLERQFIKERHSLHPNGYNLTEGGTGGNPGVEGILKIAAKRRGRKQSPEAIAKRAAANRGQKRKPYRLTGRYAKNGPVNAPHGPIQEFPKINVEPIIIPPGRKRAPFSEEWRRRLSESQKGREPTNAKLWIVRFPDGHEEERSSLKKFSREHGLSYKVMHDMALHKVFTVSHKGFGCRKPGTLPVCLSGRLF